MTPQAIYGALTGATAQDIAKSPREPASGLIHVLALAATKLADGLVNPKLVLTWLLTALGAPATTIGLLVPVREAGALLPQLALARRVEAAPQRKWFWSAGAAVQGVAALGIAAAALLLEGATAGWTIVALLALLAVARSACSVSYKDALARTIEKRRRGAITGAAASAASVAVLLFGALLASGLLPLTASAIAGALALAGLLWLFGAALFTRLDEPRDAVSPDDDETGAPVWAPLLESAQLRLLVSARILLAATALAPPYLVLQSSFLTGSGLAELGPFVLASGAASILSAYVWGRLADRSSRRTLVLAGALGAATLAVAGVLGWMRGDLGGLTGAVACVFVAQIAYEGVRSGRNLHLTDMADDRSRARYTAASNSVVGLALLGGGGFGLLAHVAGPATVLGLFALLCALGAWIANGLDEVQAEADA